MLHSPSDEFDISNVSEGDPQIKAPSQ
jgi:hypothetical protein